MTEFTRSRAQLYLAAWLVFITSLAVTSVRQGGRSGLVTNPLTQVDLMLAFVAMAVMYGLAFVLVRDQLMRDRFGHNRLWRDRLRLGRTGGPVNPVILLFLGGLLGVQLVVGLGLAPAIRALRHDRGAGSGD